MNLLKRACGLLLVAVLGLLVAGSETGCQKKTPKDDPTMPRESGFGPGSYVEVPYQGAVYVVGSEASAQKVRTGQMPTTLPYIRGEGGRKVYFETGGEPGLTGRLQGEYLRRHPR